MAVVATVRLASLALDDGPATTSWLAAVKALAASLAQHGVVKISLNSDEGERLSALLAAASCFFASSTRAQLDWRSGDDATLPSVLSSVMPRAASLLSRAGRVLLTALSRSSLLSRGACQTDLATLLEPAPLRDKPSVSFLSLLRAADTEPREDCGLLTILYTPDVCVEFRVGTDWVEIPRCETHELIFISGCCLQYVTANALQPCTYRLQSRGDGSSVSAALHLHGAPGALLPSGPGLFGTHRTVADFERVIGAARTTRELAAASPPRLPRAPPPDAPTGRPPSTKRERAAPREERDDEGVAAAAARRAQPGAALGLVGRMLLKQEESPPPRIDVSPPPPPPQQQQPQPPASGDGSPARPPTFRLVLKDQSGVDTFFRVKPTTSFATVAAAYAEKFKLSLSQARPSITCVLS